MLALAACGGGGDGGTTPVPMAPSASTSAPQTEGTGSLVVVASDADGRGVLGAAVTLYTTSRSRIIGRSFTDAGGTATFNSVPPMVDLQVVHEFGMYVENRGVNVTQGATTRLAVTLQARRPAPTLALLPVTIPEGGLSADHRELLLKVTVVASMATPFTPASYGNYPPDPTPSLALSLRDQATERSFRLCDVWLDRTRTTPVCGDWDWTDGTSPYAVSVGQFAHDATGRAPGLVAAAPTSGVMLLTDQSERVGRLDPAITRSFAMRGFVARMTGAATATEVSLYGFAADRVDPPARALLPRQPLWSPLGTDHSSIDPAVLRSVIQDLEPLLGGGAPVYKALDAAFALLAARAPGSKALVAVLGGSDDTVAAGSARDAMLTALRRVRDATGVLPILVDASVDLKESAAIAELAAALRAPVVALPLRYAPEREPQLWSGGIYSALQLAAELVDGAPLRSLTATFRVKTYAPSGFVSGTTLRGTIITENDICPMGCGEVAQEFVVIIP